MKQVIQSFKSGELMVADVPAPLLRAGQVLVRTSNSLVSAGTERMVVDFAEKSLLEKARARPDLVKQTLDKARREGVLTTLEAVQNRLDQSLAMGYSAAGTVLEVGQGVTAFRVGDRVACAGGGYAVHAEIIAVPENLVVKLPENVGFEAAAFTTLGAIALQGIRLTEAKLGEIVAVIGLGLLGQLAVQMLKAAGCIVVGMDIQLERAELARKLGADAAVTSQEELVAVCGQLSGGHGADAVLITAATSSNGPVEAAGEVARDKGIVVAVGAVGMTIPRKIYYEKELDFRISRSYGPGRYDPEYEEKGHDYPYAYVRWTEQRNMQAFVQLVNEGKVDLQTLITHRFPVADAAQAYDLVTRKTGEPFLGVLLMYPDAPRLNRKIVLHEERIKSNAHLIHATNGEGPHEPQVRLGVVGAGGFANGLLLPAIMKVGEIEFVGLTSGSGLSTRTTADRFHFAYCTTDLEVLLSDSSINTVAIVTRHHLHARQVIAALQHGKHIFVEKPLCLTHEELQAITVAYRAAAERALREQRPTPALMVGYNRRFAPFIMELKEHVQQVREPLMLHYRVNAGYISPDHWTQDPTQGGGRLRGEGCHFIDLLMYLANSELECVTTRTLPDAQRYSQDNLLITLEFADGSLGNVTYVANGDKVLGKEYLEVFGGGLAAQMEDYRTLRIYHGDREVKRSARLRQDKGHQAEWEALNAHLVGMGPVPIAIDEIVRSTEATLAAYDSLQNGETVQLPSRKA